MTWILIAYLLGLLYLTTHTEKLANSGPLRTSWIWFALVPMSQFFFSLIRTGNANSPRDLALVEIWADGISWLLLGISLLCLTGIVAARRQPNAESTGPASATSPHH